MAEERCVSLRIVTEENTHRHQMGCVDDHTLCGLTCEYAGDPTIGIMPAEPSDEPVDCPLCVKIIEFCKAIPRRNYLKRR